MKRLTPFVLSLACVFGLVAFAGAYPKPSLYPISWELKFEHSKPKRVVLRPRDGGAQQAYWYMTYSVTNLGRQEVTFIPVFELMMEDGTVIRSDGYRYEKNDGRIKPVMRWAKVGEETKQVPALIPAEVLETIRSTERNPHLEAVYQIGNTIRLGEDQAREGVVVWPEADPEMGQFSIFVTGLSGEAVILKDDKGEPILRETSDGKKPIVLRKTLKIDYHMLGDDKFPGTDAVELVDETWIMR